MRYPNEAIVKNILSVLFSKRSLLPEEQRLFGVVCRELGLGREDYAKYNAEWQKRPRELIRGAGREEDAVVLAFMLASAYFDNVVYSGERETLLRFCALAGLPAQPVESFVSLAWTFDFAEGVVVEALDIKARLAGAGGEVGRVEPAGREPRVAAAGREEVAGYVATQVGREGIDELQALYMCAQLGLNAALSGPPGIGKTESVLELARLLELPLFTKTCSARTSESHIISHPVLMEKNGVSVTAHEDGALCRAMLAPGLFYGDEYNLLKEDVQKRMNSAFDDRRSIDRNDGSTVRAKSGFMAVISYNPTQDFGRRDLEDSVADRFVHFRFDEWPSDLRAYISAIKADRDSFPVFADYGVELETRGIGRDGRFVALEGERWIDFFGGGPAKAPEYRYHCLATKHLASHNPEATAARRRLDAAAHPYVELALRWSRFVDDVNQLAATGRSWLVKELGLGDGLEEADYETMMVHRCSTRIIAAALSHYKWLTARGASPYLAQSFGTGLIANQMAYGVFGSYKLRDKDNLAVLEGVARAFRLYLNDTVFKTELLGSARTRAAAEDAASAAAAAHGGPSLPAGGGAGPSGGPSGASAGRRGATSRRDGPRSGGGGKGNPAR